MNILFINNWNLKNGLTVSTTFPSIDVLSRFEKIKHIFLITPEYKKLDLKDINLDKTVLYPIDLSSCGNNKIKKYICYEKKQKEELLKLCSDTNIDIIIARGAQAGGRAWWLSKKINKPFFVESFEPHSEYMLESKVWKSYDPRYIFQKYWENGIITHAKGIIPVAKNYENLLNSKGVDSSRLATVPCTVDLDIFKYNQNDRKEIRDTLNIKENSKVGIYVGKFGDIYYDDEAYQAFDTAFELIKDFNLLILTPQNKNEILNNLNKFKNIDIQRVHIKFVKHSDVPKYLSASDYAYEFHRAKPNTLYCSPIKVGEYWASGLPIIISKGVGDDARLIKELNAGAIFNPNDSNYKDNIQTILNVIKKYNRQYFMNLAKKYRNRGLIKQAYDKLGIV